MRWPFMLRSTHERETKQAVLEFEREEQVKRLAREACEREWKMRFQELYDLVHRFLDARSIVPFEDSYFFPPAQAEAPKPARVEERVEAPRQLTGLEVVARAEAHRNQHARKN